MDGSNEWLEGILARKSYEETPLKVLKVEKGAGPGKGDNYFSQIQKIKLEVLLGSGRVKNVCILIKREHETEHMKKLSADSGAFVKEIMLYRDVLPKMQEMLDDINDVDGIFWAKCYDVQLFNRLVFEDLGASGYRMADRKKQLSLAAALMAVKHFAKFHALSKILLEQGFLAKDAYSVSSWMRSPESRESTKKMVESNSMKMCAKLESWGGEWKEAAKRLKVANLGQRYNDLFYPQSDEFVVLCHGDTWTNNMMFKGEDLESPSSCRIVDFQLCFINSPARDLSQFFFSSVRLEDRKQNTDLILKTYSVTLNKYLLKLGYGGPPPTADEIRRAFDRRSPMLLSDTIGFAQMVMGDGEEAPDLEEVMKKHNEALSRGEDASLDFTSAQTSLTPEVDAIIKYEIKRAMSSGVI